MRTDLKFCEWEQIRELLSYARLSAADASKLTVILRCFRNCSHSQLIAL
uniref:Uncharacterized protein n=1 Tax=Synechocystis sp. PCC 9413 TaxID=77760 RepID=A0A2P0ZGF5_9SYNC|nr:hypothetical protein [Synechocystis sp. PCC 9413]